jgi:hypothetical protein
MVSWSRRVAFKAGRSYVLAVVGLLAAPLLCCAEPAPIEVAERMLQPAGVTRNDVVFDLGSGDGRIVILAANL